MNLVQSPCDVVYAVLAGATHDELQRLSAHAEHVLGEIYLPEPSSHLELCSRNAL